MASNSPNLQVNVTADTSKFDRGMKAARSSLTDFQKVAASPFKTAAAAVAGVTAALAGVSKAVGELSEQNQALGDAWGRLTAGMTASWDAFKTALANTSFDGLLADMREANRLARDLYDAQDAMGEIGTSYNIALARQMETINALKVKLRDVGLAEEDRVAAGRELLKIYEDLEKNPTRGLLNVSEASLDKIADKLGYQLKGASDDALASTRRNVEEFFVWLGSEAGEAWNKAYADAAADPTKLFQTTLNAQNAGLSESYRAMLYNYQNKVGDKDRVAMEQAVTAYYNQQAKYSSETLRIQTQINSVMAQQAANDEAAAKAASTKNAALKKELELQAQIAQSRADLAALDLGVSGTPTSIATTALGAGLALQSKDNFQELLNAQFGDSLFLQVGVELDKSKLIDLSNELNSLMSDLAVSLGESIGGLIGDLVTGGDAWGNFSNAALTAFGDMAISVGKIAIAVGLASEQIKASLGALQGWGAIAAGTALVALGAAVKSGLSNVASGNYSASASVASGSYNYGASDYETRELNVNVSGTLQADGSQLVAVLNNTNNKKGYTT